MMDINNIEHCDCGGETEQNNGYCSYVCSVNRWRERLYNPFINKGSEK